VVKVIRPAGRSTLTTGAWVAPLTGGSTADGMIGKQACARAQLAGRARFVPDEAVNRRE
jgi:hypothetical protein